MVWVFAFVGALLWVRTASATEGSQQEHRQALEEIRQRYISFLTLNRGTVDDPRFEKEMTRFDEDVQALLDSQILDASHPLYGTFGDVKDERSYRLSHSGFWAVSARTLALAYTRPASKFFKSQLVMQRLSLAFKGYGRWVYPGCPKPANWWAWDIGMPLNLVDTFILLQEHFSDEDRVFLHDTLKHLIRTGTQGGLGANAIWVAWIQFRFGMSVGDLDYANWGYETLNRQSQINSKPGEGIKPDYSYHFHAPGMNMGYGVSHYKDMSGYIFLTHGTAYAVEHPDVHVKWYLDYIRWLLYRNADDLYAYGRAGTRTDGKERTAIYLDATLPLVVLDVPEREEIVADCKRLLADIPEFFSLSHASEQRTVEQSDVAPAALEGFRYYPYSSYAIWRTQSFMGTLRLDCTRNKKWFSIHNENLLGHRITDGHLPLWVDGFETAGTVLPCQDWERLSGITAAPGFVLPRETVGQSEISGCATYADRYGLAAMRLVVQPQPDGARFSALKSYFFLPDAVICLVSDASVTGSEASEKPYTVLAQIPWNRANAQPELIVDGKAVSLNEDKKWNQPFHWLHFRERGLVNLVSRDIELTWKTSTAPWSRINQINAPDGDLDSPRSCSFMVAETIHETAADSVAYAVLPAQTSESVRSWAHNPPVEILRCDASVHAVRARLDNGNTLTGVVFFREAQLEGVTASESPCIMLWDDRGEKATIPLLEK